MRRKKGQVSSESSDDEPLSKKISEAKARKTKSATNDDSSSESDIENYLQPANKIDLSSSFFNLQKVDTSSADKNEGTEQKTSERDFGSDRMPITTEPAQDSSKFHFQQLQEYTRKMDEMKKCAEAYKRKQAANKQENISNLLAEGELKNGKETLVPEFEDDLRSSEFESFSESEKEGWEEVKEQRKEEENVVPKEGLQITVEMPGTIRKKKSKVDVMASIKRRINRIKKEHQVLIHKVHLLCWIAHGNHVSTMISSPSILALALSLVPSEYYRPVKRVDLKYLENLLEWYRSTVSNLKIPIPRDQNLHDLLETQISKNATYDSKEMIVYIFIAILRSLGIQCRLVLSFQVEPIRPPDNELISLSTKDEKSKVSPSRKKSRSSSRSSVKDSEIDDKQSRVQDLTSKKSRSKSTNEVLQLKVEKEKTRSKSTSQVKVEEKTTRSKVKKEISDFQVEEIEKSTKEAPPIKVEEAKTRLKSTSKVKIEGKETRSKITNEISHLQAEEIEKSLSKSTKEDPHLKVEERKTRSKGTSPVKIEDKKTRSKMKNEIYQFQAEAVEKSRPKRMKQFPQFKVEERKTRSKCFSKVKVEDKKTRSKSKKEIAQLQAEEIEKGPLKSTKGVPQLKVEERKTRSKRTSKVEVKGKKTRSRKTKDTSQIRTEEIKKTRSKSTSENTHIKFDGNKKSRSASVSDKNKTSKTVNSTGKASKEIAGSRMLRSNRKLIPQMDGVNDSNSDEEMFIQADVDDIKASSNEDTFLPKRCSKRLSSLKLKKHKDIDSEDQFKTRSPFLNKNKKSKVNGNSDLKTCKTDSPKVARHSNNNLKQPTELPQRAQSKSLKKRRSGSMSEEDSDYIPQDSKKKRCADDFPPTAQVTRTTRQTRKIIRSDKQKTKTKQGTNVWVEVFVESVKKWVSVDVGKGQVNCINELFTRATQPIVYIVAWNNNGFLRDVTGRYCEDFNTVTRKLRVDSKWWEETLKPFVGRKTARDKQEDEELERQQLEKPLPKSIAEYKNHPLYVLKRHLLKFEALYPPDTPTLGFIRNEPVYPRQCVYTLHSRETWFKKAKVVKLGEKPYKIVKCAKWDKFSKSILTGQSVEIFGPWQTEDYVPPAAENGVVPRNAFGNVELFRSSMLPKKTVHLKLAGLNKVAKRMNIDCAPAITGFNCRASGCHPVYEGFVVCEEFVDILIAAWELEQDEMEQREQEKLDKRVYGNWRKLIRGLLIRERLQAKYKFGEITETKGKKKSKGGSKCVLKKKKKA